MLVSCSYDNQEYNQRKDISIDNLELGCLYAVLESRGIAVRLMQSFPQETWLTAPLVATENRILESEPDYVGFFDPINTFAHALQLARSLRKKKPDLVIIFGGLHASLFSEELLGAERDVDYVLNSGAEFSLPLLIDAIENGKAVNSIPGLTYRERGTIKQIAPCFDSDPDTLPIPYRVSLKGGVADPQTYYNIVSSWGCPGRCTFCSKSTLLNRHHLGKDSRWRSRSPENVVKEMTLLYRQGVRQFLFFDDNWIGNREFGIKRALKICSLIEENGLENISFSFMTRPDTFLPSDRAALQKMKGSGLSTINFGLEAGNIEQLKQFGKNYDLNQTGELIDMMHDLGIMVRCGFIMFFPYSTFEMLKANAAYINRLGLSFMFNIYPRALNSFSAMTIEKKLQRDSLVKRPTTYDSPGVFRYLDPRIGDLKRFMLTTVLLEIPFVHELLIIGDKTSRISRSNPHHFISFRKILRRIGLASHDLFIETVNAFESSPSTLKAVARCLPSARHWKSLISELKIEVEEFKTQLSNSRLF